MKTQQRKRKIVIEDSDEELESNPGPSSVQKQRNTKLSVSSPDDAGKSNNALDLFVIVLKFRKVKPRNPVYPRLPLKTMRKKKKKRARHCSLSV